MEAKINQHLTNDLLANMAGTSIVELIETLKTTGLDAQEANLYAEVLYDQFYDKIDKVS